jgi:hypothetical protein
VDTPRISVTEGLDLLSKHLNPIIASRLQDHLKGDPWTVILDILDENAGKKPQKYSVNDLQAQLKMLTRRLGRLGFFFDDHTQTMGALGRELTIVRNRWAHNEPFDWLDAFRTHDFIVRTLAFLADSEGSSKAQELRDEAAKRYFVEAGLQPKPLEPTELTEGPVVLVPEPIDTNVENETDQDLVAPDPTAFTRDSASDGDPILENKRYAFEPWILVPVGDVDVLDNLPRKGAKGLVRSTAEEIIDAEGPIQLDRLTRLIGNSFGLGRIHSSRAKKIVAQIKATKTYIDKDAFVWPQGMDPSTWIEFRPNTSEVNRPFHEVSPVEIANAIRFWKQRRPDIDDEELDRLVLSTFGRRRQTQRITNHLNRAKAKLLAL